MSMLRRAKELVGIDVVAQDGHVGKVDDLVLDPLVWTVQYAVVRFAGLLGRVKLLIPRNVIQCTKNGYLGVSVSKLDLMTAALDDRGDLSPRDRKTASDMGAGKQLQFQPGGVERLTGSRTALDPNLQLAKDVIGYRVRARNGDVGRIRDFIINPATWIVVCVVASTRVWFPSKKILVPVPWVDDFDCQQRRVGMDLNGAVLHRAPRFDPNVCLTMERINALLPYYADAERQMKE
jgi:uncharacterized protein YrrD